MKELSINYLPAINSLIQSYNPLFLEYGRSNQRAENFSLLTALNCVNKEAVISESLISNF